MCRARRAASSPIRGLATDLVPLVSTVASPLADRASSRCALPDGRRTSRFRALGLDAALSIVVALAALEPSAVHAQQPVAAPHLTARVPVRIIENNAVHPSTVMASATDASLPLKPRSTHGSDAHSRFRGSVAGGALGTVITSLAVVLGLFALAVLILRKTKAGRGATLPGEVVQTLGRAPLNGRQEMHLVRVGNKLLLLSVTATGAETLTEIVEPDEIDRLAGICRQNHPDSITASFREILWQCGHAQRA